MLNESTCYRQKPIKLFLFHRIKADKFHTTRVVAGNGGIKPVIVVEKVHSDGNAGSDNIINQNHFIPLMTAVNIPPDLASPEIFDDKSNLNVTISLSPNGKSPLLIN